MTLAECWVESLAGQLVGEMVDRLAALGEMMAAWLVGLWVA